MNKITNITSLRGGIFADAAIQRLKRIILALRFLDCRAALAMTMLFVMLALPAHAEESKYAVCDVVAKHIPADNVIYKDSAEVPASLNPVPAGLVESLEVIKIPLDVDFAGRVQALTGQGLDMSSTLGVMEISQDGTIKYNGEDWTKPVKTLCGQSHKEVIRITITDPPPVGVYAPPPLPNALAVTADEAAEMPAVSAPVIEAVEQPAISKPVDPVQPLIGTPKTPILKSDVDDE